jgi:hypothetical protein
MGAGWSEIGRFFLLRDENGSSRSATLHFTFIFFVMSFSRVESFAYNSHIERCCMIFTRLVRDGTCDFENRDP